jgi:glycosyltransferase involved in cell wall biosynthesis
VAAVGTGLGELTPVRILSTLTFYHPHWTGLTVVARRLAEGLVARGHSVTVLTSQHEPDLPRREDLHGVMVERVPVFGRLSRTVIMPTFPIALIREVARADIVHLHTPMPESALVAAVARLMRTPVVITHHGDVVMPSVGLANRVVQRVMDAVTRWAMQLSERVVVHTDDYRDHSAFLAPLVRRIGSIYPPVEFPPPRHEQAAAWRRELGLQDDAVIGFAGRFVEEKGFDFLLRAIPFVRKQLPSARFVFAGDTEIAYERFFERSLPFLEPVREAVVELGLVGDAQRMADFYAMCDVFVLPSRTDCFAIVQVEALLCGTPLVTSDIPGAREVVKVTGAGTLVPPGDPPALAEGIVRVLADPARYRPDPMQVRDTFDAGRSIDRYDGLLRGIVGGRTRARRRRA